MCPLELVAIPMPSPIYTFGGNFMKLGTTLNGISGAFIDFGRSDRPPPRPAGGAWGTPEGVGFCVPSEGAWAPPEGVGAWANRVTAADSASAPATPLIRCVFIYVPRQGFEM